MGASKKRREQFFADHPRCCFCAGQNLAAEEDHQPGRVFFLGRKWPEGFVFPSCIPCNRVSRDAENRLSVLIANVEGPEAEAAYRKRVESVRSNYPEIIPSLLQISANQKRAFVKRRGLELPSGLPASYLPIVHISPDIWLDDLQMLGRKLLLALHYQTHGKPLSVDGAIWLRITTNGQDPNEEWMKNALAIADIAVTPARARQFLHDQFFIRYAAANDPRMGFYVATLQKIFVFMGLTTERPDLHPNLGDQNLLRPFNWTVESS